MDRTNFLRINNARNQTYAQFTPQQLNKLNPSGLPDPQVGSFPQTSFPVQISRARIFDGVEPQRVNGEIFTPRNISRAFDGVGGAAGILGAASLAAPALVPAAAAAGVAYGIYKLGNTFNLW